MQRSHTDIVNALSTALNNGVKVKVLLDDYQGGAIKDNMFLDKCRSNQDDCEVRAYSKPLKVHIITRDSAAFRYCDNPGSNIAVASFNRPDVVENATDKVFGRFFNNQTEYAGS
jgi:flavoprotein